ncbi:Peptidase family M50 [Botrimarina colliarenosi]|uniref:Peptidase family M50 n=1 Tax=Botrimarina colliarenosi TaxID=2528001 RepID=A0A5C6A9P3_9BACT|nr:site-2 protease family protein [Botrimarina colliarenosi]TWT96130.1 Peptidase family M50 [Botrimarina colliarenosi]
MNRAAWLTNGRLRARRDLLLSASGEATVVKDPLSLEYFRLGDRERFLLETLREPMTIGELTRRFQGRFPNERATGAQVLGFCASLYDCDLLQSDQPSAVSAATQRAVGQSPWWAPALNPLAIRLPGFDPTRLLHWLTPLGRLLFSRGFAATLLIAAIMVGVTLVGRAEELALELRRLLDLFDPSHAALAVAAVVIAKAWHELGHALACRRMGAECHEVGVLLLALMPCLYCDASDAWTLPSRWRRTLVALAGVYFELILSVAAAAAWLVLAPGPTRVLALYLVGVASVSTLLVNLNPLLRFDGYYVLADLWGVANLHQASRETLWGPVRRWIRGEMRPPEPAPASPWLLALYALASTVYGWGLLAVILWVTHLALTDAGFRAAGDLVVALTLTGVVFGMVRALAAVTPKGPHGRALGISLRLGVAVVLGLVALWGIASISFDQTLHSVCRVESQSFADVVARSSGVLSHRVRYGDVVEPGQLLAELEDADARLRRLELLEREASLEAQINGLRTRSQRDARLLAEIARLEPMRSETRRQLRSHDELTERRRLRAPIAGRVDPPAQRTATADAETPDGDLPTWSGAPLDPANDGCWLEAGEPLCRVAGAGVRVVLLLSEDDSGLVRLGAPVRVALDRAPGETFQGEVTSVALAAADADLADPERRVEEGLRGPLERGATYRLTVELSGDSSPLLQPGAIGQARVVTGRETLGGWLARWLRRLVRLA